MKLVMNFRFMLIICALFSVTQFAEIGHAQYLTGPVASGAGGAGRAATEDGEQFLHNPAAIAHSSRFNSSLFYVNGDTAYKESQNYYGATITDNTEDLSFAGGYMYAHRKRAFEFLPTLNEDFHHISMGSFISNHISVGVGVTYLRSVIEGGEAYTQWNGDLGFLINPTPDLGVGFVAYNVAGRQKKVPVQVELDNVLAIGANYVILENFRIRGDILQQQVENPNHFNEYQIGFESPTAEHFIVRVGYDRDELADRTYWTAGATFDGPKLKADYFIRKNFEYGDGSLQGVDLRLPFW